MMKIMSQIMNRYRILRNGQTFRHKTEQLKQASSAF